MDRAEFLFGLRHRRIDRLGDGDVEHHARGLAAGCVDLLDRGGQRLGAARGQRHLGAVAGEEAREMPAEAARAAGDQNMLIGNFEHGDLPERRGRS